MGADYATLLRDHVTLECRSIDRIFLQAWVPKLQSGGQVCNFLVHQRGYRIPSSAAFGKIGEAFVREVHRWAKANRVPVIYFQKGQCKEEIARPLIDDAAAEGGAGRVVLIGIAQEKASVCSPPQMKVAVARLERAMGQRLRVVSGYRTAGYQAQLCQRVTGPCAPPGQSMHQLGLA